MIDLGAADQALRLFKLDIELEAIKPKPCRCVMLRTRERWRGSSWGRDAKRARTTQELTMHELAERAMNMANTDG